MKAVEHVERKILLKRRNADLPDDGTLAFERFGGVLNGGGHFRVDWTKSRFHEPAIADRAIRDVPTPVSNWTVLDAKPSAPSGPVSNE